MAIIKVKFVICFGLAALTAGMLFGCKGKSQTAAAEPNNVSQQSADSNVSAKPAAGEAPTLRDIIAHRRGWSPTLTNWYGKDAPDFNVTDIDGNSHSLSQYKGRNVMVTFWATWCGPCIQEIPHLIELRKEVDKDKLAMLAISLKGYQNSTEKVKRFVAANPVINYTIISEDMAKLPSPYNSVNGIPCTFFVDPNGKIKIITEGMTPLPQMKAILEAQR